MIWQVALAGGGECAGQECTDAGPHDQGEGGQTTGVLAQPITRYTVRSDDACLRARVQELTNTGW